MPADKYLTYEVVDDELVVRIGIDTLAFAADHSDLFNPFDEDKNDFVQRWKVIDNLEWAKDVVREINREEEDGSSPLTNLLDKASENALDQGSIAVWGPELGISEEEAA